MASLGMRSQLARLAANTPTVPLRDDATGCTIWLKLEFLLPSGSTKDRVAAFVLSHGIETGAIDERTLVVEASSGSTSIAFAMACAVLGLRFRAVMPEGVSGERILMIRRYGGEVVLTPKDGGVAGAIEATRAMAAEGGVFLPRQFENPLNALAHQRGSGPELIAAVDGTIHGFCAGVGTGGTLMGIARALREHGHSTFIARVVPEHGVCFENQPEICGGIPGVVEGLSTLLDECEVACAEPLRVPDVEALRAARELVARGFPVGPSTGLNLVGARRIARRLGPGHNVATVACDRMERYFSTDLFHDLRGS
ncbi:MAG TPA: cysteine synthase family protein [Minicystis sp.]|nr:cysteine synthase family protein [Minicystis sp.]